MDPDAIVLDEVTPLGFRVVCRASRWRLIAGSKHPAMRDRLADVAAALSDPLEIRRSTKDPGVLLFHRHAGRRWVCAVARYTVPAGLLITAYPADAVKRGDLLWTR